jgi:flagella synthesis protein FlgN
MTQSASILPTLQAEHHALQGFVALLEQEERLLVENETEPLLILSEQKSDQAANLTKLIGERRVQMESLGRALNTQEQALWKNIVELGERAKRANQTNGELIHMKLRHNQQALSVLSNAAKKSSVYGPDGQANFAPGSGRSLGSV